MSSAHHVVNLYKMSKFRERSKVKILHTPAGPLTFNKINVTVTHLVGIYKQYPSGIVWYV